MSPKNSQGQEGFCALPQRTMAQLLCLTLTRRELSTLLLVIRLTYGCRHQEWVILRPSHLGVIGIGANHAGETLTRLLTRGLLVQEGAEPRYRIGMLEGEKTDEHKVREAMLGNLVGRQLSPQNGKVQKVEPPLSVGEILPEGEKTGSRNENPSTRMVWRFSRSQSRFVQRIAPPIEKEKINLKKTR